MQPYNTSAHVAMLMEQKKVSYAKESTRKNIRVKSNPGPTPLKSRGNHLPNSTASIWKKLYQKNGRVANPSSKASIGCWYHLGRTLYWHMYLHHAVLHVDGLRAEQ